MAVTVSQEWIDNQNADVRKPGFIVVNLPDLKIPYGDVSYYVEKNKGYEYISDNVGCEYLDNCEVTIHFNSVLSEGEDVTIQSFDLLKREVDNITITSADIVDNNYIWHTSGFSTIRVNCDKDVVENIQMDVYGLPKADIISYEHARSFDPVGFSLPTNSVDIEVFNYGDRYTDICKDYVSENYRMIVYYGYHLESGDEIIDGGTFYTNSLRLLDDTVLIGGESKTALMNNDAKLNLFDIKGNENGEIIVPINKDGHISKGTSRYKVTFNLLDFPELSITPFDLLEHLRKIYGISYNTNDLPVNVVMANGAFNLTNKEILVGILLYMHSRCIIDRQDTLFFTNNKSAIYNNDSILLKNCKTKYEYTMTKEILKFKATSPAKIDFDDDDAGGRIYNSYDAVNHSSENVLKDVDADMVNNKMVELTTLVDYIHHLVVKADSFGLVYDELSRDNSLQFYYRPLIQESRDIEVSTRGDICDINSPIAEPASYNRIVKYFKNRDVYNFNLRGNPARDVGDYVNVSLTDDEDESTYKKGLVVSSVLSFDGSFKEEVEVRIIHTEFEGIDLGEDIGAEEVPDLSGDITDE